MTQESNRHIDDETVRHVASLAHLELTGEERVKFGASLQKILAYVAQLETFSAGGDGPQELLAAAAAAAPAPAAERPDLALAPLPVDLVMAGAPAREGSAFLVPRIIE